MIRGWRWTDGKTDCIFTGGWRRLAEEGKEFLAPGGRIYWEIGWNQADAVKEILKKAGYLGLRIIPDLAGNDRVVTGEWTC